jgi:hypothetical protein
LWALERQRSGEELWKNRPGAKSTILPQLFLNSSSPSERPQNLSTIFPQLFPAERAPTKSFYNFSTIIPRLPHSMSQQFTLVRK